MRPALQILGVLVFCTSISCVDFSATQCASGRVCPEGTICTADQQACIGINDHCGNGVLDADEACDDGNVASGDGCNATCSSDESCGNGIEDAGEDCDCGQGGFAPGPDCEGQQNSNERGMCTLECRKHCGDGKLNEDEECDGVLLARSCLDYDEYDWGQAECSSSCTPDLTKCGVIGWKDEALHASDSEILEISTLQAIWGSDKGNIFAAGETSYSKTTDGQPKIASPILYYDGQRWSLMDIPMRGEEGLDVTIYGIRGTSERDVFAVGGSGTILHYDGSAWSIEDAGSDAELTGVWSSGAEDDVLVVGKEGTILRRDRAGQEWTAEAMPADVAGLNLEGIWGNARDDVFAVGEQGTILHHDGQAWAAMSSPTTELLFDVWGTGASDVFAVGTEGTVLHYNGKSWQDQDTPTEEMLVSVWGTGSDEVYAVGRNGMVLRYDGNVWTILDSGTTVRLHGVWGTDGGDFRAVGDDGKMIRQTDWSRASMPKPTEENLLGVWANDIGEVVALVNNGGIQNFDGAYWSASTPGTSQELRALWDADDFGLVAVGDGSTITRFRNGAWSNEDWRATIDSDQAAACPAPEDLRLLYDVWSWDKHVFVVGRASKTSSAIILHHDGQQWRCEDAKSVDYSLFSVWGRSTTDVLAVGSGGTARHYDGTDWSEIDSGTSNNLYGLWGSGVDYYAVGDYGTIMHYVSGVGWSSMSSPTTEHLRAVWGIAPDDVFAVGFKGTILHYDGNTWTPVRSGTDQQLNGIWGTFNETGTSVTVTIVGNGGTVIRLIRDRYPRP